LATIGQGLEAQAKKKEGKREKIEEHFSRTNWSTKGGVQAPGPYRLGYMAGGKYRKDGSKKKTERTIEKPKIKEQKVTR